MMSKSCETFLHFLFPWLGLVFISKKPIANPQQCLGPCIVYMTIPAPNISWYMCRWQLWPCHLEPVASKKSRVPSEPWLIQAQSARVKNYRSRPSLVYVVSLCSFPFLSSHSKVLLLILSNHGLPAIWALCGDRFILSLFWSENTRPIIFIYQEKETTDTVQLEVCDDSQPEPNEIFYVYLTDVTGGARVAGPADAPLKVSVFFYQLASLELAEPSFLIGLASCPLGGWGLSHPVCWFEMIHHSNQWE